MSKNKKKPDGWLRHYFRGLAFVWPHRRYLIFGLVAALGVSIFYTLSVSSIVPFLKVLVGKHESLADSLYRTVAAHRLGCRFPADEPEIEYIRVVSVKDSSALAGLGEFDRIRSVNGEEGIQFDLYRLICRLPEGAEAAVAVALGGEPSRLGRFVPRGLGFEQRAMLKLAGVIPGGRDPASRLRMLGLVMGALAFMALAGGVSRFTHEYLIGLVCERAMLDLRTRAYANVLRVRLDWFSQQQAGDTMSRFARDSEVIRKGIRTLLVKTVREPLKAAGVLVLTLYLDWHLLLAVLMATPIAAVLIVAFGRRIRRAERKALAAWGLLINLLDEKIAGIRIVKAYHMERRERVRFFRQHRRILRQQLKIVRTEAATSPSLEFLGIVAVGSFVLYGGYMVFYTELSPELFLGSVACLGAMFDPIRKLANVNNHLQAADAAAQRLFAVIDTEPEEPADAGQRRVSLGRLSKTIEFRNVSFNYASRPETPVLQDINLTIPAGQITAIVGPNGAGKTTLCHLLMRFYEPQRGSVLFDGVDISKASLESLRRQIGLVTQDTVIFTDTVRENIAYGHPKASLEEVLAASRTAHADDFVQQLYSDENGQRGTGYDAMISFNTLSGGQRQRLAIARAILRDPAILIFDEATSQVDSESEMKIQEALDEIMRGRTTFLISHRFSTIARADRIVVMDEGRIVAEGRHDRLVESCGLYKTLYERQFRGVG